MELNQKLKTLREAMGLTQEELALRLNVSRSAIAKWEQGQGWPSLDMLKSLALFFHTSIDDLLGEQGVHLFEHRQKKRFWIVASAAIVSLSLTMVSTTLLIIELKRAQTPALVSEVIRLDAVTLTEDRYEVTYADEDGARTLSFDKSFVSFRDLDDWSFTLTPNDYLAIERYGEEVRQAVLLDNAQSDAIKGYDLVFETPSQDYRYYYHEYMAGLDDYSYLTMASDIPYLGEPSTHISNRSIAGQNYFLNAVSHTIYADSDISTDTLIHFALKPLSMTGVDREPVDSSWYGGLNMIQSLNTNVMGQVRFSKKGRLL